MPVETVGMPTLLPRLHFDDTDKPDVVKACGCGCAFRFEYAAPLPKLAPVLHFWPEPVEGAEFRTFAKEDVNLFFQRVGVVSRCSHILYVFPEALENLRPVVEDNHAVAGIATWSPEEPGLVAAEGRGESLAATKEIDSAGLAIVLGEDAAVMALINGDAIPGDSSFINNFFPAELVGVPLRQRGPGVRVFDDRKLERELFWVGVEDEEDRVADQITPSQRAVGLEARGEEQREQPREPDRGGEGIHQQGLLEEVGERSQHDVTAFGADAAHELDERPVVLDVPEQVGKENE